VFLKRIAKIFVQGNNISRIMAREFRIDRGIDVIPTMCPDEAGDRKSEVGDRKSEIGKLTSDLGPQTSECRTGAQLRFGILCRFTEQKGIRYILEALKMFKDEHGKICFTFAGMGPLEELIRKTVDREQLTDVKIVRVESATDVLKQMDVFVHPGLDDAMPVSIVEALMCGVPCIGSDVGGVPDLIRDGIEGFLVEPASSAQILQAMNRFAAMKDDELEAMSRQARARYEEVCAPEKVGASVAEHYRELMASSHDRE
jgi:glycosyltransferase involved in cell wall biosynthesis